MTTSHGDPRQGQHLAFPFMVKHSFVRSTLDRPKAVHTSHVVHTIHGLNARVTPIMESRVTSGNSLSSTISSVPGGRSGSTM